MTLNLPSCRLAASGLQRDLAGTIPGRKPRSGPVLRSQGMVRLNVHGVACDGSEWPASLAASSGRAPSHRANDEHKAEGRGGDRRHQCAWGHDASLAPVRGWLPAAFEVPGRYRESGDESMFSCLSITITRPSWRRL